MISLAGPGCAVTCNLINTHTHTFPNGKGNGRVVMRENRSCKEKDVEDYRGLSTRRGLPLIRSQPRE